MKPRMQSYSKLQTTGGIRKEDIYLDNLEIKDTILKIADQLLPIIKKNTEMGDVAKLIEKCAPISVLQMYSLMVSSESEKTKLEAAKTLAYMAGYKPIERNVNIEGNIEAMSETQLDSFIQSAFDTMSKKDKAAMVKLIETSAEDIGDSSDKE